LLAFDAGGSQTPFFGKEVRLSESSARLPYSVPKITAS